MATGMNDIDYWLAQADAAESLAVRQALIKIENLARAIMVKHPAATEFVMGMGDAFFVMRKGNIEFFKPYYQACPKYMSPLFDFIKQYNTRLKLTSESMRFTATGKKILVW